MVTKHFNHSWSGNYPIGVADRYYAQDMARDFWHGIERAGRALYDFYGQSNVMISGGQISQGSSVTKLNITAAVALGPYTVTIPNSFAALPPTFTTAVLPAVLIDLPAQTDFDLVTSGATLDGTTVNYLKLAYAESAGNTRNYAKKSGSYAYESIPSFVLTCTDAAPAANEVLLGRLTGDGSSVLTITYQIVPKNAQTLMDNVCPVGTLRHELTYQAPSQNYPWLCLDKIGTYIDATTTEWDVAFIDYLRAIKITLGDGTVSPQSAYNTTNWAVASSVATITFANTAAEIAILLALSEDQSVHSSFTNWRTITLPTNIGNILAGTYAITGLVPSTRTVTFAAAVADGSGAVSSTVNFYAHRIAGSTTSARLYGAQGIALHTPNDANNYMVNSLRRRGFMQGFITNLFAAEDGTTSPVSITANDYIKRRNAFGGGLVDYQMTATATPATVGKSSGPVSDGTNGTPRVGKETHSPLMAAHLFIYGRTYKL